MRSGGDDHTHLRPSPSTLLLSVSSLENTLSVSVSAAFSELFFKRMSHGLWAIYTCVVVGWMRRRAFTDCHGDKIPVHVLAYTHVVEAKQNTTFFFKKRS